MVANRFKGIYAVHANDPAVAYFARRHENANVLVLGAGYNDDKYKVKLSYSKIKLIIDAFLDTDFEGGRHTRRVDKINNI